MILDLSKTCVAIVGVSALQAEKIQVMLCADVSIEKSHVLIESRIDEFLKNLDDQAFDAIILGGGRAEDFETLRKVSALAPTSAVIYVTDHEDASVATAVLAAGAQDVIVERFFNGVSLTKALVHGMERARMRAELKATNQRLVRLNEEMNRFLGMAAHDLRGPIGTIGGFAELVLADAGDRLGADNTEALRAIGRSSKAMVRLIEELLDMSKIESGKHKLQLSRLNLSEFIAQCVRQHVKAARLKDIVVESVCRVEIDLDADADKLTQVMDNLISNAVKYSPRGTKVNVEGLICEDGVEVRVRDWGPGIAEEEVKQLFSPFFRGAARPTAGEQSTGLGLPIVKGIVNEHNGRVGVTSAVGAGSTFWFRIPQHRAEQPDEPGTALH